jgi:hypothetical protein
LRKSEAKSWISDEIPGRLLKRENTTTGAVKGTSKMELLEVKNP